MFAGCDNLLLILIDEFKFQKAPGVRNRFTENDLYWDHPNLRQVLGRGNMRVDQKWGNDVMVRFTSMAIVSSNYPLPRDSEPPVLERVDSTPTLASLSEGDLPIVDFHMTAHHEVRLLPDRAVDPGWHHPGLRDLLVGPPERDVGVVHIPSEPHDLPELG